MIKVTLEYKDQTDMLAFFAGKIASPAPVEAPPVPPVIEEPKVEPTPEPVVEEKPKRSRKKPEPKPEPVVEEVEEEAEEESEESYDREAILSEARDICTALLTGADKSQVGEIKGRILNIIREHGGEGKMSSIEDDAKLYAALEALRNMGTDSSDDSFV